MDAPESKLPVKPSMEPQASGEPTSSAADLDQLVQRHMEPFLQRAKEITLEAIDEVGRRYGAQFVGELRQTLTDTVGTLVKSEITVLVERLKPEVLAGAATTRQKADVLLADLKAYITTTVTEVFQVHVPAYSRWAGHRVVDYVLGGVLYVMAAVLACVGGILALERAGLPTYVTYLIGAAAALTLGLTLFRLRSRHTTMPVVTPLQFTVSNEKPVNAVPDQAPPPKT